jgi:hypothetical protein
MKRYVLGIDPGVRGALALVETINELPRVKVFDMPIRTYYINGSACGRARIEEAILNQWFTTHAPFIERAVMEEVHSMPKDGPVQAFTFGYANGLIKGMLTAYNVTVETIDPATWKKPFGLSSDKNRSRLVASRFFPQDDAQWSRKIDDGRAEAALLGIIALQRK